MSGHKGFGYGLMIGFGFWLVSVGRLTFTANPAEDIQFAKSILQSMAILATALTILVWYRKKSFFDTTTDGLIFGVATSSGLMGFISPT